MLMATTYGNSNMNNNLGGKKISANLLDPTLTQRPLKRFNDAEDYIVVEIVKITQRRISFSIYNGLCKSTSRRVKSRDYPPGVF